MGKMKELQMLRDETMERLITVLDDFYDVTQEEAPKCLSNVKSRSLILLVDDCLNSYFNGWNMISRTRENFDPTNRASNWGNELRYAANWIRHHSDWFEQYLFHLKKHVLKDLPEGEWIASTEGLKLEDLGMNNNSKKCLGGLMRMLKTDDVLSFFAFESELAWQMVNHLELHKVDKTMNNVREVIIG